MTGIFPALALALRQLSDPAVMRVLGKSVAVTCVLFLALAAAGWFVLDRVLQALGLGEALFAGANDLRALASALLALGGLWLVWRVVAMLVIQFFAADVVQAVEARHYPAAASAARSLTTAQEAKAGLRAAGRAVLFNLAALPLALVLLFTGIGPALVFWAINAALLGRELQDMVWLRHCHVGQAACPVSPTERFLLGGAVAALMLVPFANFLAPVLGAAAATHLVHRKGSK
ncbi:EI24 domain-containing protein [Alteraurantiacibacter palmitatis]|uniref:EI24 domain-containing protein n=1 Tax=Alteraurantiacibacter palmitatis TaxID=2054628 RepID=A0ABV7E6V1_9SPHN